MALGDLKSYLDVDQGVLDRPRVDQPVYGAMSVVAGSDDTG